MGLVDLPIYLYIYIDFFGGKLLLGSAWYLLNGFFNPVLSSLDASRK